MAFEWDEKGLMIRSGETVLADEMGRMLDRLPTPSPPPAQKDASRMTVMRPRTTMAVAPSHGQDIVVDPAGNAFSVRVHLAQHLRMNQRVKTLEEEVAGKFGHTRLFINYVSVAMNTADEERNHHQNE